jgi:hypothetical protein
MSPGLGIKRKGGKEEVLAGVECKRAELPRRGGHYVILFSEKENSSLPLLLPRDTKVRMSSLDRGIDFEAWAVFGTVKGLIDTTTDHCR